MENNDPILLVGTGAMGREYAKVFRALGRMWVAVGRGEPSVRAFTDAVGIPAHSGGIDAWLKGRTDVPRTAVVAVSEAELGRVARSLLGRGVKRILLEKPGGATISDIRGLSGEAERAGVRIFVAYNRRFYASVLMARQRMEAEGGVTSFRFDFTEWSHVVQKLPVGAEIKASWFLHNSTHVLDMAFHLGGFPVRLDARTAGSLPWHPTASRFVGSGETETGVLFSYHANWEAPGRWSLEILTKVSRYIFCPLEKLHVQNAGSVVIQPVELDDRLDVDYKPGLFRQTDAFLRGQDRDLLPLGEQTKRLALYSKIAGLNP